MAIGLGIQEEESEAVADSNMCQIFNQEGDFVQQKTFSVRQKLVNQL
jgi:hypothetical protein